jgi:acyl-CoA thioesterase-1
MTSTNFNLKSTIITQPCCVGMNILFFGDSLTAGYGLAKPAVDSFPALIQRKLDDMQLDYKVINGGISGETTSGGLARIDNALQNPVDVFVLALGINDLFRGIPHSTTGRNLQAIIDNVLAKYPDAKLVLLGMEAPGTIAGQYGVEFRSIFRHIAEKNKMAFLPFLLEGVAGNPRLNIFDRLHPSAEGYKVIAEKVWNVLKTVL